MVGVPGKYKGCETCRRRRVKCTNERPFCQKCIANGRQCEGYERERVFITGTPETRGRVASHPPKNRASPSGAEDDSGHSAARQQARHHEGAASDSWDTRSSSSSSSALHASMTPMQPLTSAWDDFISIMSHGVEHSMLVTALQTQLAVVSRSASSDDGNSTVPRTFTVSLPPYVPTEVQPYLGSEAFSARSQCIAQLAGVDDGVDSSESYCVFLYENSSTAPLIEAAPWRMTAEQMSDVQRLGPAYFRAFPNHHFFSRVYRPMAVSIALLSRRETFLSSLEWTTTPWEQHPKSQLDHLFDIVLVLPSIFSRTDRIIPLSATLDRRLKAQELLQNCLRLEHQFRQWLQRATIATETHELPYWTDEGGELPFPSIFTFCDGTTGLVFLYYWMSQILFHRCIDSLFRIIFEPVVDAYQNMWPELPPELQVDPSQYQQWRQLATNICRGLDSTLNNTVQPDMVLAPMTVALDLYREINATSREGVLELLWLESFRTRLGVKGQHVANVVQAQRWTELATF